jgi:threonine/homoserine/homoserine lactone efflux protein
MDLTTLAAFVPAALAVVVPCPDTMYTVTRSLGDGRAAGVAAGCGTATGVLLHTGAGVALFADRVRGRLLDSARIQRTLTYLSGSVLVGFGVGLVLDERPV